MDSILEVKNLCFSYDKENIIDDLTFSINRGDYVGIIGRNGAGKSTLIKLMLGLLKPKSGSVNIFGKKIGKDSLSKVGYVPQVGMSRGLDFPATVEEVVLGNAFKDIGLFRFPKKKHRDKVVRALSMVGMESFKKVRISDLSGGQQQRVMIARALVSDPEILFLDEPTAGIDYDSEENLYKLLDELNQKHDITIIMISHDISRLKIKANKIVHLHRNSMVASLGSSENSCVIEVIDRDDLRSLEDVEIHDVEKMGCTCPRNEGGYCEIHRPNGCDIDDSGNTCGCLDNVAHKNTDLLGEKRSGRKVRVYHENGDHHTHGGGERL